MQQIVDLQSELNAADIPVQLISIGVDPVDQLASDAGRLGITTPLVSDPDGAVTRSYGLPMVWSGKPGHIFVLVGKDGAIKWAKDYAIPGRNPVMYVPPDEISREVSQVLEATHEPEA